MKALFYKIANFICCFFPKKKTIVFESNPDLSCNSFEVFKNMLTNPDYSSFSFIWLYKDYNLIKEKSFDRTRFVEIKPKNIFKKIKTYLICNRALVAIASCNPFYINKGNSKQIDIYLDHGSQLKNMKIGGNKINLHCHFTISQGRFFNPYIIDQYELQENQIINCGIPRNDQFYRKKKDLSALIENAYAYSTIVAWVPTFRISSNGRTDCSFEHPFGIPVFQTADELLALNHCLKQHKALLIIKPHPAQLLESIKLLELSNVVFVTNDKLLTSGFHTNELLLCCDAMITDYSGIYYDYLCLDRPIGITLDDYEIYKSEHGFVFENPLSILKGFYIYCPNDFKDFLVEVFNGVDSKKDERSQIKSLINDFDDGKSSQRFCDFLAKFIGIQK